MLLFIILLQRVLTGLLNYMDNHFINLRSYKLYCLKYKMFSIRINFWHSVNCTLIEIPGDKKQIDLIALNHGILKYTLS